MTVTVYISSEDSMLQESSLMSYVILPPMGYDCTLTDWLTHSMVSVTIIIIHNYKMNVYLSTII